jgi:hypothetical protein
MIILLLWRLNTIIKIMPDLIPNSFLVTEVKDKGPYGLVLEGRL